MTLNEYIAWCAKTGIILLGLTFSRATGFLLWRLGEEKGGGKDDKNNTGKGI
jgi:hypothetical protein